MELEVTRVSSTRCAPVTEDEWISLSSTAYEHYHSVAAASAAVTRTGVAPETWFGKGKRGPVTARLVVPLTSPGTGVAHVTLRAPHDG